jgi:Rrf2 family iron-sulfur cluster assembly transcriptional regulator
MFNYGLRALGVLADNYNKGLVSAKEISELENISPSFLEQLLARLRRHGLISGMRGPGGGFKLSRHPSRIRITQIIEALEGPFLLSKCLEATDTAPEEICERYRDCPAAPLYKKIERDLNKILGSYRLSDLLKGRKSRVRKRAGKRAHRKDA